MLHPPTLCWIALAYERAGIAPQCFPASYWPQYIHAVSEGDELAGDVGGAEGGRERRERGRALVPTRVESRSMELCTVHRTRLKACRMLENCQPPRLQAALAAIRTLRSSRALPSRDVQVPGRWSDPR